MAKLGIALTLLDLEKDKEKLDEFIEKGHQTAPIVEVDYHSTNEDGEDVIETDIWSGYDPDKIKELGKYYE